VKKSSVAGYGLYKWVQALSHYYDVARRVKPLSDEVRSLEMAKAVKEQNLLGFEKAKEAFSDVISADANVLKVHINDLYDTLLEDNLRKIIEPYSEVQIDYVAEKIGLPLSAVQQKLSEMILDEKIDGTLDQGRGCLTMFEEAEDNKAFDHTIGIFDKLSHVIDAFYEKTKKVKEMSQ
jgi:26S proteasome regulatory subunit N6